MQKQLLLSNLRKLYHAFKEGYPVLQVDFSKFCSLRPKLCAGALGTHSVCLCSIYHLAKLLVDALPNNISHKALFKLIVCDDKNRKRIMRQCDQCPDDSESRVLMCELLQGFDDISFKKWQTTDKCTLMNHSAPVEEYIDMFVCAVEKSCSHSFLATSQSHFLH